MGLRRLGFAALALSVAIVFFVGLFVRFNIVSVKAPFSGVCQGLRGNDDFQCSAYPGNVTDHLKTWDSRECRVRAAVMEQFSWHEEVIPTSVQLLAAAGADCIAVLRPIAGIREFDIYEEMHRWARGVSVFRGVDDVQAVLASHDDIRLVIVDTVEDRRFQRKVDAELTLLANSPARPQVVLGCHNLEMHLDTLKRIAGLWTDRNVTSMVFAPRYRDAFIEASRKHQAEAGVTWSLDPIVSVPFYFGPDALYGAPRKRRCSTKLLGTGALSATRRDYTVLEQLVDVDLRDDVDLVFFGVDEDGLTPYLKSIEMRQPRARVSVGEGSYRRLYDHASTAAFVVLYLDDHSSEAVAEFFHHDADALNGAAAFYHEYTAGKLSSALAYAIGFFTPVIGSREVLQAFAIHGQMEVAPDGSDFGKVVEKAVAIFQTDPAAYNAMRAELCTARERLFVTARDRIAALLGPVPDEGWQLAAAAPSERSDERRRRSGAASWLPWLGLVGPALLALGAAMNPEVREWLRASSERLAKRKSTKERSPQEKENK
mmetsp:Transcript_23904/g.75298  ORF Transcript_23904/g.75298 Transcript_23904/m.75298 type:complete len:542 (-) Transcript_23904:23-1648(-)